MSLQTGRQVLSRDAGELTDRKTGVEQGRR